MTFHEGELAVQERAGVRQMAARIGASIHQAIPPAAAAFMAEQSLAVVGWAAPGGAVWASLLAAPAGFLAAPDPRTIAVNLLPAAPDPLADDLAPGLPAGMLIIDLATRRRMRANGRVIARGEAGWTLRTDEVYSNCPKYIQARAIRAEQPAAVQQPAGGAQDDLAWLDSAAAALIGQADTCFIASAGPGGRADASHRGGAPGFVRVVDAETLELPDYQGNMMFNTLGNLAAQPRAGLLFVDWASGATLQLSGTADIVWEPAALAAFPGAERLVRFRVSAARRSPCPQRNRPASDESKRAPGGAWRRLARLFGFATALGIGRLVAGAGA